MLSNDELFDGLDRHFASALGHRWRLEVYGIHSDASGRWVQLSVQGRPRQLLTLCLASTDGVQQVMRAVSGWITQTAHASDRHVA
jgi:hypothetical protein